MLTNKLKIKIYFTSLIVFLLIDFLWLGLIAKDFYASQIGYIMTPEINWLAAFVFYFVFVLGLCYFVIFQYIEEKINLKFILSAIFFGFVTYATYDLTNLATLRDWPLLVTIVDLIWGSLLSLTVSLITHQIVNRVFIQK